MTPTMTMHLIPVRFVSETPSNPSVATGGITAITRAQGLQFRPILFAITIVILTGDISIATHYLGTLIVAINAYRLGIPECFEAMTKEHCLAAVHSAQQHIQDC